MSDMLKGLFGGGDGEAQNPADAAAHVVGDAGHKAAREARRAERAARKALSPEDRDHLTAQANDFVQRYTTGGPAEGYTGEEALKNFLAVSEYASPEQLQRATQQAVANLPSDQRAAFGKMLEERQQGTGLVDIQRSGQTSQGAGGAAAGGAAGGDLFGSILGGLLGAPAGGGGAAPQGGGALGDILGQMMGAPSTHGQQGGDLTDILGSLMGTPTQQPQAGGLGDILGQMMGGAQAQQAPQPEAKGGGLMDNPMTKMVLGGIAAYAMKEILANATKGRA